MVNTILKYIGSSVKASLTFLDNCYAPAFRIEHRGEVYYGDGVAKENVSISDSVGNGAYIRLLQPETARETKRINSCSKKFNYSAKCRLVYYSFTDDSKEWPIDKRKQAIKNVLNNLTFLGFKEMSSEISISINTVDDNFQKVFKAETNQEFSGDKWPFIIAIDFTINYSTSTDSECQDLCVNTDFEIIEPTPETNKTFCDKVEKCEVITELQNTVVELQEQIDNLPSSGLTCETLSECSTIIEINESVTDLETNLNDHINDYNNPHEVTLEQVRSEDNSISGDINANNNTIINLKDAVNPQEPITKMQFDTYVSAVGGQRGDIDCSTNPNYPASNKGDRWEVTVAGKIGGALGIDVQLYDEIVCKTTTVGGDQASVGSNFYVVQGNLERATETTSGYVQLATDVETQGGTENTKATTALKLANWWTNVKTLAHTFAAKITFTTAPRFSSVSASQVLTVDANKDLTSEAKETAFNKPFGTTAGTVTEGGTTLLKAASVLFTHAATNLLASTTYYFGQISNVTATSSVNSIRTGVAPITGNLVSGTLCVYVGSTLGSAQTATLTVYNKTTGTSQSASINISYAASFSGYQFDLSTPLYVTAGNLLDVRITTPAFTTNPQSVIHFATLNFIEK